MQLQFHVTLLDLDLCIIIHRRLYQGQNTWRTDSSVVVMDSRSIGPWLESRQEQQQNSGRIFFFRVKFCTLILVSAPPMCNRPQWHVKHPSHSAKGAGGRLQLKRMHSMYMWLYIKWHRKLAHAYTVYTERAVSHGTSHVRTKWRCKYTTLVD